MKYLVLSISAVLCLAACSTPYQKFGGLNLTGGYYDEPLPTGEYRVGFKGNGFLGSVKAMDYGLIRVPENPEGRIYNARKTYDLLRARHSVM